MTEINFFQDFVYYGDRSNDYRCYGLANWKAKPPTKKSGFYFTYVPVNLIFQVH